MSRDSEGGGGVRAKEAEIEQKGQILYLGWGRNKYRWGERHSTADYRERDPLLLTTWKLVWKHCIAAVSAAALLDFAR